MLCRSLKDSDSEFNLDL